MIFLAPRVVCVALVLIAQACQAQFPPFYVATDGNDSWSGTLIRPNSNLTDGPFATVQRARDAVRAARNNATTPQAQVIVEPGTFYMTAPLVLEPQDSNTVYTAQECPSSPCPRPVLSVGVAVGTSGWSKSSTIRDAWVTSFPQAAAGVYPHQLFVNGQRRTRARLPDLGDYYAWESPLHVPIDAGDCWGFVYNNTDLRPFHNMDDVNIIVYHSWTASRHFVASLDTGNRTVMFTTPTTNPIGTFPDSFTGRRYYVDNVIEGLDSPGEWYLDREAAQLYYYPLAGEDVNAIDVVVAGGTEVLVLQGDPENEIFVDNVVVQGLSLQHADWTLAPTDHADYQSAAFLNTSAVFAVGVRSSAFLDVEIAHVGGYAVWLEYGCSNVTFDSASIFDMGAGGVRIGTSTVNFNGAATATFGVSVRNSVVTDGGHVFPEGTGVFIQMSSFNNVQNNELSYLNYDGVSAGWQWGFQLPSTANNNLIEYNYIHHIGQSILTDLGAIYTLGIAPGTVVRNNLIHDVSAYGPCCANGLYMDEGTTGTLWTDNIVYNTKAAPFHQHLGAGNLIANNIFVSLTSVVDGVFRTDPNYLPDGWAFERNVVYFAEGPLWFVEGLWQQTNFTFDSNVYFNTLGLSLEFPDIKTGMTNMTWTMWQAAGQDVNSLVADPMFADPLNFNFTFASGSPVFELGITQIDTSSVGPSATRNTGSRHGVDRKSA
eukprot:TRINITY_DN23136_c0_g1_i1.p1 TRINITY_DN23136_c0_g1~~TRINITY_DN23136_c0_g1_i1.p1  ORF type:complete len:710 (+),score=196.56 TRINITY_DN23136_c0_g1_i1:48-2177(+)